MIVLYTVDNLSPAGRYPWDDGYGYVSTETIEDATACDMSRYASLTDCLWIVPGTYIAFD